MKRRALLSSVPLAAAGIAGCFMGRADCLGAYSVSLDPLDDVDDFDGLLLTESDLPRGTPATDLHRIVLEGDPVTVEEAVGVDLFVDPSIDRRVDPSTVGVRSFSTDEIAYVWRHDALEETFDGISRTAIDAGTVVGPAYAVNRVDTLPDDVPEDEPVAFSSLPLQDRWRLVDAVGFTSNGEFRSGDRSFVAGFLDPDDHDASALVEGLQTAFVELDGQYLRLERGDEGEQTVERIRYEAERIATDVETFAKVVVADHGVDTAASSDGVRQLLDDVLVEASSMRVCDDDDDADPHREAIAELKSTIEGTPWEDHGSVFVHHRGDEYDFEWWYGQDAI